MAYNESLSTIVFYFWTLSFEFLQPLKKELFCVLVQFDIQTISFLDFFHRFFRERSKKILLWFFEHWTDNIQWEFLRKFLIFFPKIFFHDILELKVALCADWVVKGLNEMERLKNSFEHKLRRFLILHDSKPTHPRQVLFRWLKHYPEISKGNKNFK